MAIIGRVVAMTGTAFVLSDNGSKRELHLGDQVQTGDTIQTASGVEVDLELTNGRVIHIGADQLVAFTPELAEAIVPSALDSAINLATIETVIKAIEGGKDINEALEETAAGANGLFNVYGFGFVDLVRINDVLNKFKFAYEYSADERLTNEPLLAKDDDRFGVNNLGIPNPANLAPVAIVTPVTGNEDGGGITVSLSGADSDGTIASVIVTTLPPASQGVLTLADGVTPVVAGTPLTQAQAAVLIFTPAPNFNGTVNIPFTVTDNQGLTSAVVQTPITVAAVNDAPVANPDSASTPINTALNNIDVKANDTDVDNTNAQLNVSAPTLANPAQGTVTLNPDGTLNFVPNTGITGPVIISYTLTDPDGLSSTGTLTVNVGANTPPDSADITRTINEDTPLTLSTSDFAFTDPDALQTLNAVRIDTLPANGTLTLNGTPVTAGQVIPVAAITAGNLVFSPALNGNGANYANFSFSVQDSAGAFDTVPNSVTINVTAVNDAPVDGDETNSVTEDVTLTVNAAAGLLANSTDVDGGTPTVTSFLVAGNAVPFAVTAGTPGVANLAGVGILTINSNGSYSFAPALNYTGAIPVVTYTVDDGNGGTDTSTLTLSMTPVNDAPVANPDSASTPINTALNNIDVKANDTDVDNTNAQLN
ncbi:MAG: retention module-containing protein, partial [Methylotenera sp.]|uniref:retention module-containing protein n=2 Tax=Methylotenera sp. TaxID=2051956 RepID=UPI002717AF38